MIGSTDTRIMLKHLLPNCLGPIIVSTAFLIPAMIITEATLGYLGIGLRPGDRSARLCSSPAGARCCWTARRRSTLNPGCCSLRLSAWRWSCWRFNYLGDGLRDALDPRLAGTE